MTFDDSQRLQQSKSCVARVECARCGVLFTFLPDQSVGNSSQLPCTVELRLFLLPHAIFCLPIFLRPDTHTCAVFRSKQTAERNHHVCANVCNSLLCRLLTTNSRRKDD